MRAFAISLVRLLAALPRASGFLWPSIRQVASDAFETLQIILLDSPAGLKLIDQALDGASMHRIDSDALAADLEPELPPDLDEDDDVWHWIFLMRARAHPAGVE
jgi:hypothetical protein